MFSWAQRHVIGVCGHFERFSSEDHRIKFVLATKNVQKAEFYKILELAKNDEKKCKNDNAGNWTGGWWTRDWVVVNGYAMRAMFKPE